MRVALEYGQPLAGLSRVGAIVGMQKPKSVSASAKRSMRPSRLPPGQGRATPANLLPTYFWQLHPLILLACSYISLHGTDSAAVLPFSMPYEADSAAILPFMLLYEADSDAMLPDFLLYGAIYAVVLPF